MVGQRTRQLDLDLQHHKRPERRRRVRARPLPFSPSVTGGATNIQAGAFSPLTVSMTRKDGEQNLKSIVAKLPPGLSGILTGVELCPEPQANNGTCGPNSLIGEATVSVGVGGDPFTVSGGKFYLTGPYEGAPFGLTFEVPAKAGPFDLAKTKNNHPSCDCVLVRGKIEINPITAAITITSEPSGQPGRDPDEHRRDTPRNPARQRDDDPRDFQFNPTNCAKMTLEGTVLLERRRLGHDHHPVPGHQLRRAEVRTEILGLDVRVRPSRADGASLNVKLAYPSAPFGSQANIKQVKVELPKGLPSRLTTLQKACTAAQFHANPAGCPAASIVGHAKAITPLIPVPLGRPGVLRLKRRRSVPEPDRRAAGLRRHDRPGRRHVHQQSRGHEQHVQDRPRPPVESFELNLPEGPYSALTTDGNLCKQKLVMPTEFVAQNGAEFHQNTKIAVTGCPKHKKTTHRKKHKTKTKRKRKTKR